MANHCERPCYYCCYFCPHDDMQQILKFDSTHCYSGVYTTEAVTCRSAFFCSHADTVIPFAQVYKYEHFDGINGMPS